MSWENLYLTLLFYSFLLWAVFKLARVDRWAEISLYSVIVFLPLLTLSLGLPFGLSYWLLRLAGAEVVPSSVFATIAMVAVCKYFLIPVLRDDSDPRSFFKRLKQYLTRNSLEDRYYKDDIQHQFNLLVKGLEEKRLYMLGALVLFILIFFLGRDIDALKEVYFLYDYELGWWKYFTLFGVLAVCLFAYLKYYNLVINLTYLNLQRLMRALEVEDKYAVLTYDSCKKPGFRVTVCCGNSWVFSDKTDSRLSFFVESEDGLTFGCAVVSAMTMKQLQYLVAGLKKHRSVSAFRGALIKQLQN